MGEIRPRDREEGRVRRLIDNDLLTIISRLFVGGAFIYASLYKVIDPAAFAKSIWYYHMVPGALINLMALILPWLELLCGLGLILGIAYRGSALLINLMVLVFIFALSSAIARDINIDCGCFKAAEASSESAVRSLIFDLLMLLFSLQVMASRSRRWMLGNSR